MTEQEVARKELRDLDARIERATSRIENDSDIVTLSHDVGATNAEYERFAGDVSQALLELCNGKRSELFARIAANATDEPAARTSSDEGAST